MAKPTTIGIVTGNSDNERDGAVIVDETASLGSNGDEDRIPVIEPATIQFEPDTGEQPRKRGRKPGSRNAPKQSQKESSADLTAILLSIHYMGAALLKVPELALEEAEAKRLGAAVARINELYGGMVIPEKQMAWANLVIVAGSVYGPRFIAHNINKKNPSKKTAVTIDAQPSGGNSWQPTAPGHA